jgi:hypothetical protein
MFYIKFISFVFVGVIFAACTQNSKQDITNHTGDEQAAVQSAEKCLALVDEGKYGDSWDEAADVFKNAVSKDDWEEMLGKIRPPFGAVLERNVKTKSYETSVPGFRMENTL